MDPCNLCLGVCRMMPNVLQAQGKSPQPQPDFENDYTVVVRFFVGMHLFHSTLLVVILLFSMIGFLVAGQFLWGLLLLGPIALHLFSISKGRCMWIVTNRNTKKTILEKIRDITCFQGCNGVIILMEFVLAIGVPIILQYSFHRDLPYLYTIPPFAYSISLRIVTFIFVCDFQREMKNLNPSTDLIAPSIDLITPSTINPSNNIIEILR